MSELSSRCGNTSYLEHYSMEGQIIRRLGLVGSTFGKGEEEDDDDEI